MDWPLAADFTHLNHGSFGACPSPVLDEQERWRTSMEANPVRFFTESLQPALDGARRSLASFIGASPGNLVFVPNATAGINSVLASLEPELRAGDEIVITDHTYNACRNIAEVTALRSGATLVEVAIPFPSDSAAYEAAVLDQISPTTRLVVIDAVTSPTALVIPFARIVAALEPEVTVVVDAAHAPGMVSLDLESLGASFVVGNCHKWMCAPKGAGFLYAREDRQHALVPTAVSHGWNTRPAENRSRFHHLFDWVGTDDPSAQLSVPLAVDVLRGSHEDGWPGVMKRNHELVVAGRNHICEELGTDPGGPADTVGSMATIVLPGDSTADFGAMDPLTLRLRQEWQIEVPVFPWRDWPGRLLRISAHLYNDMADYEKLAASLRQELQ